MRMTLNSILNRASGGRVLLAVVEGDGGVVAVFSAHAGAGYD